MGWEYHNRPRDDKGRWTRKHQHRRVDLHLMVTPLLYDEIKAECRYRHEEMSEYVSRVLRERIEADEAAEEAAAIAAEAAGDDVEDDKPTPLDYLDEFPRPPAGDQ